MEKRILVTGGTGSLGNAVKGFYMENIEGQEDIQIAFLGSKHCDLTSREQVDMLFRLLEPTHVIHLAGRVGGLYANMENKLEFLEDNVLINMNVLHNCYKCPATIKTLSCMSTCIFPDGAQLPLKVGDLHNGLPHDSNIGYAYAKRMIDVENRILYTTKRPFIGVIPTNMFGPHDNFDIHDGHVIPALIHKCWLAKKNGTEFEVRGSGTPTRQFLYSKDAGELIWRLLDEYRDVEPVILAPPEEYSISQVVDLIVEYIGFAGITTWVDMNKNDEPEDVGTESLPSDGQKKKTADTSQISQLFSDFEYTPFKQALKETIDWFVANATASEQ